MSTAAAPSRSSVLVTLIGITHLLLGLLIVGFGVYVLVAGAAALNALGQMRGMMSEAGNMLPQAPGAEGAVRQLDAFAQASTRSMSSTVMAVVGTIAGCSLLQGVFLMISGAGVLRRSGGNRGLALLLAALLGIEGVACLLISGPNVPVRVAGCVLIAYTLVTYLILLSPRAALEFAAAGGPDPFRQQRAREAQFSGSPEPSGPADQQLAGLHARRSPQTAPSESAAEKSSAAGADAPATQGPVSPSPWPVPGAPPVMAVGGSSGSVLFASVVLSAAVSAATAFAVLRFLPPGPNGSERRAPAKPPEPYTQKGTVKMFEQTGTLCYPIPYASPPQLTLTNAGLRRPTITRQDEFGFAWSGQAGLEEFTWEAKGIRIGAGAAYPKPFEQKGSFRALLGQQGVVNFPLPYVGPANVTLGGNHATTVIVSSTPFGFTWKNTPTPGTSPAEGEVTWTVQGVRATLEEVREQFGKAPAAGEPGRVLTHTVPFEQSGQFTFERGLKGEIAFAQPFAAPPSLGLAGNYTDNLVLTEVTARGFKWCDRHEPQRKGTYTTVAVQARWTARGVKAAGP